MGTVTTTNGSTFQNVAVQFAGQLMGDVLSGDYAMGTNGALPGGQAITYQVKPKPQVTPTRTATRTPTPEQKTYRITVLKRNDDTKEGLPGWEFNLYLGPNCNGNPLASGVTDASGIIEFAVPVPSQYSVKEKLDPNDPDWNNVTPLCQNVTAGPAGAAAAAVVPGAGPIPSCPIPNGQFPQPGCDSFSSLATVKVLISNPNLGEFACDLSGPTQIVRHAVENKPPDSLDTEIVFMKLTGTCQPGGVTITVRESPTRISAGRIVEQQNGTPGTLEFPASSFFNVYFEVVTPAGTFHNVTPGLRMACKIASIPPYGCFYEPPIGSVPIFHPDEKQAGLLIHASHLPIDPKKDLVIFINAPKRTPTVTPQGPTSTPTPAGIATPTRTPTPASVATATGTPTPAGVVTPTATPTCACPGGDGDVNKNGLTNAIDVTLMLQHVAGLFVLQFSENADVDQDGDVDAIDAALTLQAIAGLIPGLPI
jgi:hypothetical protein